jgi:hypothetical protein
MRDVFHVVSEGVRGVESFILDILVPKPPFLHNIKCEREVQSKIV